MFSSNIFPVRNMQIELTKLRCLRCSNEWHPRKPDVRRCPRCRSFYWDREPINKNHKKNNSMEEKAR